MKKFQSIAFLLSAMTGLSMLLLVMVFSVVARDAYHNRQFAAERLADVDRVQALSTAKTLLRLTNGRFSSALDATGADVAPALNRAIAMQARLDRVLDTVTAAQGQNPKWSAGLGPILAARAGYEKIPAEVRAALRQSDAAARARANRDGVRAGSVLVAALDKQSALLSTDLASTDTFMSEMMKFSRIAWKIRDDAGANRYTVLTILASGGKPSPQQLARIAEIDGRIGAPWAAIADDIDLPLMPEAIKRAFARVNGAYLGHYRDMRQELLTRLGRANAPVISPQQWLNQSDADLDSIMAMADTALDLSRAHIADQLATANHKFHAAIGFLIVTLMVAASTMLVVVFRVIRPLRRIVQSMKIVMRGDLEHKIPFKQRHDEIGELARALKTFRDHARERLQMEGELLHNQVAKETAEASNRIKTEFLANMSHELRTPLNAVIGFSDMMRQKIFGPLNAQYEDYAVMIFESGQLLLNLVSDILDIAKIEAGKFTLDPQTVDLADVVGSCLRLIKKRADDNHIALAAQLPPVPVQFVADPRGLKQILLNLLSNAVKFTPQGGRVEVIGEVAGSMVKITVRDDGIGIPADALQRIGHAFEQASNDPTRAREGTGLGLALVRALADQHGGTLTIDSTEHVGTTVTVELPLSQDARKAA